MEYFYSFSNMFYIFDLITVLGDRQEDRYYPLLQMRKSEHKAGQDFAPSHTTR